MSSGLESTLLPTSSSQCIMARQVLARHVTSQHITSRHATSSRVSRTSQIPARSRWGLTGSRRGVRGRDRSRAAEPHFRWESGSPPGTNNTASPEGCRRRRQPAQCMNTMRLGQTRVSRAALANTSCVLSPSSAVLNYSKKILAIL